MSGSDDQVGMKGGLFPFYSLLELYENKFLAGACTAFIIKGNKLIKFLKSKPRSLIMTSRGSFPHFSMLREKKSFLAEAALVFRKCVKFSLLQKENCEPCLSEENSRQNQ